jgi:hypothetical protein
LLFLLTISLALALAAAVALAPMLEKQSDARSRLVSLFAQDVTVRRTALASAAGLLATAYVFFRARKPAKPRT